MKIRNPWIIKWISLLGAWLIRLYMGTICVRFRQLGQVVDPRRKDLGRHYIYALFHENILLPCIGFSRSRTQILISQHADGELLARLCMHFGLRAVRGSSTRGGVEALRKLIRAGRACHLAVIPDGPRGPRRHVQPGIIYLASRTGMPIVIAGVGYKNPWRLRTWDRFAIPRPFSEAVILAESPITIPPHLDRDRLEEQRLLVESAMQRLNDRAERIANRS